MQAKKLDATRALRPSQGASSEARHDLDRDRGEFGRGTVHYGDQPAR